MTPLGGRGGPNIKFCLGPPKGLGRPCLLLNEDSSFALLRPNPVFLPKNLNSYFRSRDIVLKAFHPPPHSSEAEAELHLLCLMRALAM